jgi:hypothetical protein
MLGLSQKHAAPREYREGLREGLDIGVKVLDGVGSGTNQLGELAGVAGEIVSEL